MNRSTRTLASTLFLLLLAPSALADAAPPGTGSSGGAVRPQEPQCTIASDATTWRVPVNTPGIPIRIEEFAGAKLTPTFTLIPNAPYTFLADTTSGTPETSRLLKIQGAKAGEVYDITIGGQCAAPPTQTAIQPGPVRIRVEYIAETPAPTVLGTLTEDPKGTTLLTMDPSFLPFAQVATLSFSVGGTPVGVYGLGSTLGSEGRYGVIACVAGACNSPIGPQGTQPLHFGVASVCKRSRSTGELVMEVNATGHIAGSVSDPAPALGVLHIDCSKATDGELGIAEPSSTTGLSGQNSNPTSGSSGCSTAGTSDSYSGALLCALGIMSVFARRRRA